MSLLLTIYPLWGSIHSEAHQLFVRIHTIQPPTLKTIISIKTKPQQLFQTSCLSNSYHQTTFRLLHFSFSEEWGHLEGVSSNSHQYNSGSRFCLLSNHNLRRKYISFLKPVLISQIYKSHLTVLLEPLSTDTVHSISRSLCLLQVCHYCLPFPPEMSCCLSGCSEAWTQACPQLFSLCIFSHAGSPFSPSQSLTLSSLPTVLTSHSTSNPTASVHCITSDLTRQTPKFHLLSKNNCSSKFSFFLSPRSKFKSDF